MGFARWLGFEVGKEEGIRVRGSGAAMESGFRATRVVKATEVVRAANYT